ncbi:KpsF/GutQ family sugar-phosphate isomerase, partial [bacterium]|nr:KpsF/GutQ family sugar-phosphate isomerase [bacterium]
MHGREILRAEGETILRSADSLDDAFVRAVRMIAGCTGSVVV